MSTLYKIYKQLPESAKTDLKPGTEIKMTISFNRDTYSWATGARTPIGYRVSVVPVIRSDRGNGIVMEESGAFTGFNDTLLPVDGRQSKRKLQEAIDILHSRMDKYLQYFIKTEETV